MASQPLTDEELERYSWQLTVQGFGVAGQEILKRSSVLISRCGGVGGQAAYQLAAAGVGRLILAHAGNLRLDDLNRQLLMTHAGIGRPRMDIAPVRLRELNPAITIDAVAKNVSEDNIVDLVKQADVILVAAPLFSERLLLNREAVRQGKPLVDCAMYDLEAQLTTVLPGKTPCLACLYPAEPPAWERRFPVLGAVAGMIGSLGALEAIKVLTGVAAPLAGQILLCDLRAMAFRRVRTLRRADCAVCGALSNY